MPKKKQKETPAEQGARFKREAEKLIADGELSATEAEKAVDRLVRRGNVTASLSANSGCD